MMQWMPPDESRAGVDARLAAAIASVPAGPWAVGVSGGADSVALLSLLRRRADVAPHVVHLDHEARGDASARDARFVAELAAAWGLPATVVRWRDVEPLLRVRPRNRSALFRAGRIHLFRQVVATNALSGIILAHHADDVAETVLQRLVRGAGVTGLYGLRPRGRLGGLLVLRPLLAVDRKGIREYLRAIGQAWREDDSNASPRYQRNRLRSVLCHRPDVARALREIGEAARSTADWLDRQLPSTAGPLNCGMLTDLPAPLARHLARRWLAANGSPPGDVGPRVVGRLLEMAADAASPPREHFPGGVLVRRRGGTLSVAEPKPASGRSGKTGRGAG